MKYLITTFAIFFLAACEKNQDATSNAANKEPLFRLFALVSSHDSHCKVSFALDNGTNKSIDAMAFGFVAHLDGGRKTSYQRVEYVKPKEQVFFDGSLGGYCHDKCTIEVHAVEFCKIDGKLYSDCLSRLAVESRDQRCTMTKAES